MKIFTQVDLQGHFAHVCVRISIERHRPARVIHAALVARGHVVVEQRVRRADVRAAAVQPRSS